MIVSKKIRRINNKLLQSKAQYNIDRQTTKISALTSGNVNKFKFLTGKNVLPEKDWLEKVVTIL